MKHTRLLFILAMLVALTFDSCDVHEFPSIEEPEPPVPERPKIELEITFDALDWPELTTILWEQGEKTRRNSRTRGGSRAEDHKLRYTVNIYQDYTDSRYPSRTLEAVQTVFSDIPASLEEVSQSVEVDLPSGDFIAVAWIDYVDASSPAYDLYYDTTDFGSISILGDDHPGNCNYREAFRGATRFSVDEDGTVVDIESRAPIEVVPVVAERPMARYEFVTTDLDEFIKQNVIPMSESADNAPAKLPGTPDLDDYIVHIRYTSYMPTTYNCYTNRPVDADVGVSYYGQIAQKSDKEATLGFDHVFVNGTETTVQVALDVYSVTSGNLLASSDQITIPLRRNHHTYIKGKFLTTSAGGGAGIIVDFDGEYNIEIR